MSRFYFIVLLLVLFACSDKNSRTSEVCKLELEAIGKRWVPDPRIDLFSVTFRNSSDSLYIEGETTVEEAKIEVIDFLKEFGIPISDKVAVLPNSKAATPWAVTLISVSNLRETPRYASQLVTQAVLGTPLRVIKKESGWSLVQTPDRYIAWIDNSSVQFMSSTSFDTWKTSLRSVVLSDDWLVTETGERVVDLVKGSILTTIGTEKEKTVLATPDGRVGEVSTKSVLDFNRWRTATKPTGEFLEQQANRFRGLPYLWGGTSSKAVDCSGFVKSVYFMNGVILARDASQQVRYGQPVPLHVDSLRKGDLLFFGTKDPLKVRHVAMYLQNGIYIHASGYVKTNSLKANSFQYSDKRYKTWVGARRYIGQTIDEGCVPIKEHRWY